MPSKRIHRPEPQSVIEHRREAAKELPTEIGVYSLCDLDEVPIYVGQSRDGIRARVRRHITSARSDIIANRQIDVWEVAYVWCWPVPSAENLDPLEQLLFHEFHPRSPLMNGRVPPFPAKRSVSVPDKIVVKILPDDEVASRRRVELRLPRQAKHLGDLLDHYLNVKDSGELLLSLEAHFDRLKRYFSQLSSN